MLLWGFCLWGNDELTMSVVVLVFWNLKIFRRTTNIVDRALHTNEATSKCQDLFSVWLTSSTTKQRSFFRVIWWFVLKARKGDARWCETRGGTEEKGKPVVWPRGFQKSRRNVFRGPSDQSKRCVVCKQVLLCRFVSVFFLLSSLLHCDALFCWRCETYSCATSSTIRCTTWSLMHTVMLTTSKQTNNKHNKSQITNNKMILCTTNPWKSDILTRAFRVLCVCRCFWL